MKQIKNGFPAELYLTENGAIYNAKEDKYIMPYKSSNNCFKIKMDNGTVKTISQKSLYKLVYNKTICQDNTESLQGQYWKQIENTDYYCSNKGRIKSLKRYEAIILKPYLNKKENGYLTVQIKLSDDIKERNYLIHHLVALTFLEVPKEIKNYQIHHKDGNRFNNTVQNLEWITKEKHRQIHGKKKVKQ